MTVKSTTDYDMFKFHEGNRDIIHLNLEKIKKSISIRNMLNLRPIVVDAQFRIIDGQHRLRAAKELQIPIYYMIKEDAQNEDIWLLNQNQSPWNHIAALKHYVHCGKKDYIKLQDFMRKHVITLQIAISILHHGKGRTGEDGSKDVFKEGRFKFPDSQFMEGIDLKIRQMNEIKGFIIQRTAGNKKYLSNSTFNRALSLFYNIRSFEHDIFLDKLGFRLDLMSPRSTANEYLKLFKEIYNFRNRNPISEEFSK